MTSTPMSAPSPTTPPALPPEVRSAINYAARTINRALGKTHYVNIEGIVESALAPLWPRPAVVTADEMGEIDRLRAQLAAAQEDKERMADLLAASLRYIPAGAPYGDFATMTKGEGSLILQVGFAIATARGTNIAAARREGGRHD